MSLQSRIEHLFDDSGFRGPVLKLLSGTGFAFVVSYAAKLVLLKLYAPADFGVFAFVIAMVGILAPIASLRYEDALMLPEDDRRAAHVLILSLVVLSAASVVFALGIFFSDEIATLFGDPSVSAWVWTIPIVLFLNRGAKIAELWLARKNRFSLMTGGQVAQSLTVTSVRVGWGLVRPSPDGLIFGFALGFVTSLGLYGRWLIQSLKEALAGAFDFALLREMANRYRRFAVFTMPAALLGAAVSQIATLLILYFFDSTILGIYSQAVAVLYIPLSQVGAAVAQVFFVRAAEAQRDGSLGRLTYTVHRRLVAMAFMPAAIAMLAGGDIFEFLFGDTWRASGEYLVYLAPWLFLSSIASPLTRLFDVLERQKLELFATAAMLIVVVMALWSGGQTGSIEQTLLFLGVAGTIVRAGQIVMLLKLAGLRMREMTEPYLLYAAYGLIPLGIVAVVMFTSESLLLTTGAAVAAGLMYAVVVLKRDRLLDRRS